MFESVEHVKHSRTLCIQANFTSQNLYTNLRREEESLSLMSEKHKPSNSDKKHQCGEKITASPKKSMGGNETVRCSNNLKGFKGWNIKGVME